MDSLTSTYWNMTTLSYLVAILGLIGTIIWWIVRRKRERVWFPILRVFTQSRRQLPSLRLRPPPWVAFLCFLGLVILVSLLSSQPKYKIFVPRAQKFNRQHLFIDLSPSVSAYATISSLREMVADIFIKATKDGQSKFSLSFSDRDDIYYISQLDELSAHLQGVDFHRFGTKIGQSIEAQLRHLGQVDVIYIFSDADAFSWEGFNWRYLIDKSDVRFMDVRNDAAQPKNVFISFARASRTPDARNYEWNVEISRRDRQGTDGGQLSLHIGGQVATQIDWQIGEGQQSTDVNVSLPASDIHQMIEKSETKEIVWRLAPLDSRRDSIHLDNDFRQFADLNQHNILIVSEPGGERFIEDPTYHLQLALETQGMNVRHVDAIKSPEILSGYDFILSYGGGAAPLASFCPLALNEGQRQRGMHRRVWLIPFQLDADYTSLCQCFSLLSGQYSKNQLGHCQNVRSSQEWAEFPRSLGAKKVGGNIGEDRSLAWNYFNEEADIEVMTFSIPLQPSRQTGLWHAKLPLLLRSLINWQGDAQKNREQAWPRLASNVGLSADLIPSPSLSNVPLGESLGKSMTPANLPTTFHVASTSQLPDQATAQERLEDAVPWIHVLAWLACVFCFIELVTLLWRRYALWARMRVDVALLIVFGGLLFAHEGRAQVEIASFGDSGTVTYQRLAKDVANRTSLEISSTPLMVSSPSAALIQPWLWVTGTQSFMGEKKLSDLTIWIRRGGFLIIEGRSSESQLQALTKKFGKDGRWQTIPADHEIMRSFYLLKSLPPCHGQNWQGFHVDGRLAILSIPYRLLAAVQDSPEAMSCGGSANSYEDSVRLFVNILLVALATDYKKDQIHLPEILKRLR